MLNVLNEMEFDVEKINSTYEHIEALFSDLHMRETAEDIITLLPNRCKLNFTWDFPTGSLITNMNELAKELIIEKYPNAIVTTDFSPIHNAMWIDVDNDTQALADKEWRDAE